MKSRLLFLLALFSLNVYGQAWSTFLDSSRAIDWTNAGFSIPNYRVNCPIQPSLTANDPAAAAANTAAIQRALASCGASRNVVNIPRGTYYVAGWTYGPQGRQVVRGAGPMSTTIHLTAEAGCGGMSHGICMISGSPTYNGSDDVKPPAGRQQCRWTAGYAQGSKIITLANCGSVPPVNHMLVLDQVNDAGDTNGIRVCDSDAANCTYESGRNYDGRRTDGVTRSQQQVVYVTRVMPNGNGSYLVTLSAGIYFGNIRAAQLPGAWWSGFVGNDGLESMTLDGSQIPHGTVGMYDCYQCWVKNVRSLNAGRNHILLFQSAQDVIRDSYFYQSQSHHATSYGVEPEGASGLLVENNIFQQTTLPIMFGQGSGSVIAYNYFIDDVYTGSAPYAQAPYYAHSAGNSMNLWEGNNSIGIWADDAWGSSTSGTYFRNMLIGWQSGKSQGMFPIALRSWNRAFNIIGNVLGQPGFHNQYQAYATSSGSGVGSARANTSIYELGWSDHGGFGVCTTPPTCDPLVYSTLMRWGNYDTVTRASRWDSAEASPAAVAYVSANFTASYFKTLPHTLPASLYYHSKPSWWPASKAWPAVGPDVSSGNLGICSGSFKGAQATESGQCGGGSWNSAWAGHANSIPAQDCYLNVMHGPPDGTGNLLRFDADMCYGAKPATPAGFAATPR